MPGGRPTTYKPEYCEMVIEAAREGKSLTSFAADIDVGRQSITDWAKAHEEFSLAVTRAKAITGAWYERQQRRLIEEGGTSAQSTLVVFGLKNMASDDWREKLDVGLSGDLNLNAKLDLSGLTEEQLRALASIPLPKT